MAVAVSAVATAVTAHVVSVAVVFRLAVFGKFAAPRFA
jgi:hypothetical protein